MMTINYNNMPNPRNVFVIVATIIILIVMLAGCSANWHIKKAISKDPSILQDNVTLRIDTTVVTRERTLTDTLVLNDIDSVTVIQDRVVTKIWRMHDTIRVNTICPSDTVRIVVEKECDPTVNYTPKEKWWKVWGFSWKAAMVIAVLIGLFFLLRKRIGG